MMAEVKGRYSKQRETIYSILCNTTAHPSVDEIYHEVRKIIPEISLGTVYRNLNLLVEKKRIMKLDVSDRAHYDARTEKHLHFYCKKCRRISYLFIDPIIIEGFISNVEKTTKNEIEDIDMMFSGICLDCKMEQE